MFAITVVISLYIFALSFHLAALNPSGSAVTAHAPPAVLGGKGPLLTRTFQSVCLEHGIYKLSALCSAIQHSFNAHKVPSVVLGTNIFIFVSYYWVFLEV